MQPLNLTFVSTSSHIFAHNSLYYCIILYYCTARLYRAPALHQPSLSSQSPVSAEKIHQPAMSDSDLPSPTQQSEEKIKGPGG